MLIRIGRTFFDTRHIMAVRFNSDLTEATITTPIGFKDMITHDEDDVQNLLDWCRENEFLPAHLREGIRPA